jgi:pSer/pThr/pTyr-binding forkhead associated (FHA) protein
VRCPRCGAKNSNYARFCTSCGKSLQEDTGRHSVVDQGQRDEGLTAKVELGAGRSLLVVRRGPNAGSKFQIDKGPVSLGRYPDSDIFLDDVTVSRRHAEIWWEDGQFFIKDLGSLKGTYLNGSRVDLSVLSGGDELWIGKFKLRFYVQEARSRHRES